MSTRYLSSYLQSSAAPGTVTGTISWTEADDVFSITGVVTNAGTVSWTEEEDTVAVTGVVTNAGVIGWTEEEDAVAITGSVPITGQISWTEVDDTYNFTGYTKTGGDGTNKRRRYQVGKKVVLATPEELKRIIEQEVLVQKAIAKTQNKTPKPAEVTKAVQEALEPVIADVPLPDVLPVIQELKAALKAVKDAPVLKAVKKIEKQLIQEQQEDDDEDVLYLLLMG